jgi:hypothetical protein
MNHKQHRIAYENEIMQKWMEPVVERFLKERGFDLTKPIFKILDWRGWCWVQRK